MQLALSALGLFAALVVFSTHSALAVEKSAIVHTSDLIVIGNLTRTGSSLTWRGWVITGEVVVTEVVWSQDGSTPTKVPYRFECTECPRLNLPRALKAISESKQIWFFWKNDEKWLPNSTIVGDPGTRPMKDLEYYESEILAMRATRSGRAAPR